MTIDVAKLRAAFEADREVTSARAIWDARDVPPNTCRYCGKYRQPWAISSLDGHARCIVTHDFKKLVAEILRSSPLVTYKSIADAIGTTPSVVQAWAWQAGAAGPVSYRHRSQR